jgi:hypothetical protein
METLLYGIFGASAVGLIFFIFIGIIAITVYCATKYAFVPAIEKFRGEVTTKQQIYALYAAGAVVGFIAYFLYVVLAVAAFVYNAFSNKQ